MAKIDSAIAKINNFDTDTSSYKGPFQVTTNIFPLYAAYVIKRPVPNIPQYFSLLYYLSHFLFYRSDGW